MDLRICISLFAGDLGTVADITIPERLWAAYEIILLQEFPVPISPAMKAVIEAEVA